MELEYHKFHHTQDKVVVCQPKDYQIYIVPVTFSLTTASTLAIAICFGSQNLAGICLFLFGRFDTMSGFILLSIDFYPKLDLNSTELTTSGFKLALICWQLSADYGFTETWVPALPNSVGNSLPIMDLPTIIHSYFFCNLIRQTYY